MATDSQPSIEEIRQTPTRGNDNPPPVSITQRAASEFLALSERQDKKGWGLRVSMVGVGCSGYVYNIEFQKKPNRGDQVHPIRGLRVFVETKSLRYLQGAVIDYDARERGFKVFNPNAERPNGGATSFPDGARED